MHDSGAGEIRFAQHLHGLEGAERRGKCAADSGTDAAAGARSGKEAQLCTERECAAVFPAAQFRDRVSCPAAGRNGAQRLPGHPPDRYPERD
ncbi:hypothetical protein SDC9_196762 [bioreactor metagenome]|uniref:Uncharacterized protein n=1 Tax=bioreactor metagenome TaxID=1076179 RepID=A0A645ICW4_9ZZZZ